MQLIITGKNMQVSDMLEDHIRRKLGKLDRYLNDAAEAQVELSEEKTKEIASREIVQVTIFKNGTIIRGEERGADMPSAIDAVVDKLERQIKRSKGKDAAKKRRAHAQEAHAESAPVPGEEPHVVRVKRFKVSPITEEQAIDQMELLGHSFFVFLNGTNSLVNIVYRREDGNYGILEPVLD